MNVHKSKLVILLLGMMMFTVLACTDQSGQEENDLNQRNQNSEAVNNDDLNNNAENKEPEGKVTLTVAYRWNEDSFWDRFDPIAEHLGNVEFEFYRTDGTLSGLEEMFSAGIEPDIFMDTNVFDLLDLGVIQPLNDLIEQTGFDLNMFNQSMLDSITAYDPEGRIIGFPDGTSIQALYYNEEVFDLFGIDYPDPEVPMTWPELMNLTREMTVERDGIQYVGLAGVTSHALNQFAPRATDPDTGEVLIEDSEGYKKYLSLYEEFYSIPGINEETLENSFVENRAAMIIGTQLQGMRIHAVNNPEIVDMVPFPVWPERPTMGPLNGTTPMMIAEYSEHKELALKVLETYFDPEIIVGPTKEGALVPPLDDPEIVKLYATEHELYKDKNTDAWHVLEIPPPGEVSKWDDFVNLSTAEEAIREGTDAITALRQLKEESEAKIAEAMSAE